MPEDMTITNPYRERAVIPITSNMFFGREQEMQRISDLLSGDSPQCVSIVGERRIGKSSLAFRVFHQVKNREKTRAVYIDCDEIEDQCQTKDRFFQWLSQGFSDAATAAKENTDGPRFDNYSTFKGFVSEGGRHGIKTIIFIDEFEHLPDKKWADDTFFSNLRALANNPDNRLAFVAVSKTVLKELTHQGVQSSGFWNIFEPGFVGLLDHESIMKLRQYGAAKTGISFTAEEIEKIHYYAGDFPFLNQVACAFAWEAKRNHKPVDWNSLEVLLRPHYEEIWKNRKVEEQKLLKDLKGRKDKEEFTLHDLAVRGLVIQEGKDYSPFSGYLSKLIDKVFKLKVRKLSWLSWKKIIQKIKDVQDIYKGFKGNGKGDK